MSPETIQFHPGSVGIGIAGMRQRIKELGGQIRLENQSPGCLVEITIPMVQEPVPVPSARRNVVNSTTQTVSNY